MTLFGRFLLPAVLSLAALSPAAAAVTVGQVDDFEDGTTQGWTAGGGPNMGFPPVPPTNIATGGPQGADDAYLRLASSGASGPGSRLTALNTAQWSGDYLAAGVAGIGMWAINLGPSDLALRLLVENPMGGPPTDVVFSADPVPLLAGAGWQNLFFSLDPDDLLAAPSMGTAQGALSSVTVLRIFHGEADAFPGEALAAQLGVDDIRALAVPEPAAWTLLIAGFGAAGAMLRRRRAAPV